MVGQQRLTDLTIQAIAQAVGIADYNYFTRLFHKKTGTSPAEFRKKRRGLI
ncbi:AraC family transcriptional regulator [Cohnella suwonensis]|uniref:AraC family transcriptional regulator n=1 Tax=Cohnella suwonensis TaxID=696072 RepID=A0ABW0LU71_9BACL